MKADQVWLTFQVGTQVALSKMVVQFRVITNMVIQFKAKLANKVKIAQMETNLVNFRIKM